MQSTQALVSDTIQHLLLSRVIELIFSGAVEAFLEARVCPQSHHGRQQLRGEGFRVLHPTHHVTNHLGISLETGREGRERSGGRPAWRRSGSQRANLSLIRGGSCSKPPGSTSHVPGYGSSGVEQPHTVITCQIQESDQTLSLMPQTLPLRILSSVAQLLESDLHAMVGATRRPGTKAVGHPWFPD